MGCPHSQAAPAGQVEAFRAAVRLQLAVRIGQSQFHAVCDVCHSSGAPICCLSCDFVGCPQHTDHEHSLGFVFLNRDLGPLWCFQCRDVVIDRRFEQEMHAGIVQARHSLKPKQQEHRAELQSLVDTETHKPAHLQPFHAFAGLRGLVNMGATCYASVVLQSLVHNPLVRAYFLAGGHQKELCTRHSCLACGVDQLYSDFFASPSVAGYGITDLLVSLAEKQPVMGAGSTEQDAHEFYLMLLNEFHNASHAADQPLNQGLGEKSDDALKCGCVAHRNFSGSIESTLMCECGHSASVKEPIVDLGLNLPMNASRLALEDCLKKFTASEQLANYTCGKCGQSNTTKKQLHVAQPPPVLLIQLKRFKHMGPKGSSKLDTPVDFALQLDMAPYMSTPPKGGMIYELYGVICHSGTLDTGHYTCMMKHSSGQWYEFDDVTVTAVNVNAVHKAQRVYLLFYIVKLAL